VKRLRRWL
jgi:hypothetical protein